MVEGLWGFEVMRVGTASLIIQKRGKRLDLWEVVKVRFWNGFVIGGRVDWC